MGHWYDRSGNPCFTVKGKDGQPKDTTLREARKLDLLPSVSTIVREADSGPMLKKWITNQALLSALTHPGGLPSLPKGSNRATLEGEHQVRAFLDWCREDSEKLVRDKADLGHSLHDAINKSVVDPDDVPAHFIAHVNGVRKLLGDTFGDDVVWESERSHACPEEGFGGTIDLEGLDAPAFPDGLMLDFKSKEFDETKDPKSMVFDEHIMQLGGYSILAKKPRAACGNVFVSVTNPGLAVLVMHSPEDMDRGRAMFRGLLSYHRAKTRYYP